MNIIAHVKIYLFFKNPPVVLLALSVQTNIMSKSNPWYVSFKQTNSVKISIWFDQYQFLLTYCVKIIGLE